MIDLEDLREGDWIVEADRRCAIPNDCRQIVEMPETVYGNGYVKTRGFSSGRVTQIRMNNVRYRYKRVAAGLMPESEGE